MKLLHKTTRDYLIASVSILVITGVALFSILRIQIGEEMDEQLELQADQIFEHARYGDFFNAPSIKMKRVSASKPLGQVFGDTLIYDRVHKEMEDYHYIRETRNIGEYRYEATIMTSHIGWKRYYLSIMFVFALVAQLLTGSGVLINYFSNKNIWKPFFYNLESTKAFSVSSTSGLDLMDSSINEFKELNNSLRQLTEGSRREYFALREFFENASHEIQTPLSIIQSKLDRVSQMSIDEQMASCIVQAKSSVERLSRLNKSLLLLGKLDNRVYHDRKEVKIDEILIGSFSSMEDLFVSKHITVNHIIQATTVYSDPYLAEIIISNLLSNTLRYTPGNGLVCINLRDNHLTISNTGDEPDFPQELIFERFTKKRFNVNSTGLGLSIVKEICRLNHWQISYKYVVNQHIFEIEF
jgi:signal transduction histidine kinase